MRAREFLNEIRLDIPDQMVTVSVPLSTLTDGGGDDAEEVVNPGRRDGEDGRYKWSPPLQQHLDAVKDSVGPSNDELTVADAEAAAAEEELGAVRRNISLISIRPSMPG
jgi:hypothetical protein